MDRYWATVVRIAWREGLASRGKFLFVVLAVAAGVGALTGVRGFARAFRTMLLEDARTLMAADFTVRMFRPPGKTEGDAITALERRGVRHTTITETISMMSAPGAGAPVLVFVKAVDPARYPFYGRVETEPAGSLATTLTPENLISSDDLLLRLNLKTGDTVKLGSAEFRLAAVTR
ncbi:MAG: ABC transporter permease, partial [Bryobacteraceae bacterium]